MKDFLHGRPSVASNRSSGPNISPSSNLPPISTSTALEKINPEDMELSAGIGNESGIQPEACSAEPQVEIVPDAEGRVGHIVVTCRCGEKITLQCNY
jgi:hypothetical protein